MEQKTAEELKEKIIAFLIIFTLMVIVSYVINFYISCNGTILRGLILLECVE